jgi:hypothetical protein
VTRGSEPVRDPDGLIVQDPRFPSFKSLKERIVVKAEADRKQKERDAAELYKIADRMLDEVAAAFTEFALQHPGKDFTIIVHARGDLINSVSFDSVALVAPKGVDHADIVEKMHGIVMKRGYSSSTGHHGGSDSWSESFITIRTPGLPGSPDRPRDDD